MKSESQGRARACRRCLGKGPAHSELSERSQQALRSPLRSSRTELQTVPGVHRPISREHPQLLPILDQLDHWFHRSRLQRGEDGGEFTKDNKPSPWQAAGP